MKYHPNLIKFQKRLAICEDILYNDATAEEYRYNKTECAF